MWLAPPSARLRGARGVARETGRANRGSGRVARGAGRSLPAWVWRSLRPWPAMRWRMGEGPRVRVTRRMRGRLTRAPNRRLATKAELAAAMGSVMTVGQIRRAEPTMRAPAERMATICSTYGGLLDGPGKESSARSFLEDLPQGEGGRDDGDATTAIVYWTERGDLPVAAERVLTPMRMWAA